MSGGNLEKVNPEDINNALEEMAILFAEAIKEVEVRRLIKSEVGKKFDGDYDALYKNLKFFKFNDGKSFEERLADAFARVRARKGETVKWNESILKVKGLVSKIPRFQVSVPVNFERWDERGYIPLVAYHPVGVDDKLVKYVKAYDSEGREYLLDAWKVPDFPVIVLGISERTDDKGNVIFGGLNLPNLRQSGIDDEGGGGGGGGDGNNGLPPRQWRAREILEKLQILDDQEPWTKGDPEIVLQVRAKNRPSGPFLFEANNFNWDGAGTPWGDDYRGWKTYNWEMFDWLQQNGEWVVFYWYEDDWDWSLGIKGTVKIPIFGFYYEFKVNLTIGDSDDVYGEKVVYLTDPYQEYDIRGMIKWYLKWRNPTSS